MTDVVARDIRSRLATMDYEDIGSVSDARLLRQKMAAAVEAAKRAGVSEVEWMLNAREAERALGRMILAAREAGDLVGDGQNVGDLEGVDTLDSLKISRDLAADAAVLAQVPDAVWREKVAAAEAKRDATYRAVVTWARSYVAKVQAAETEHETRIRTLKAAESEARERLAALKKARRAEEQAQPTVDVPPLQPDETALSGADLALTIAVPEVAPAKDARPEVLEQERIITAMGALARRIQEHNPAVRDDPFRHADLYAARDVVRRLTEAAAVWLRTYNALYESGDLS